MSAPRHMHIGLSLTPTWLKGRRPEPGEAPERPGDSVAFYCDLAQAAERACLDFVFKPDALLMMHPAKADGGSFVGLDPTLLLTAIARETQKIGLVTTASTTFNPPYVVARQMQSLNWISNGRAGWNIVTSLDGAENFGADPMPSADERYRKAAEFTGIVRQLWRSHPHEVLAGNGVPHSIDHHGEFFSVKGPLNVPGHADGDPPLFQAGASDIGRGFAASVADATFAATPDMAAGMELRADLRERARQRGRAEDAVRVLPGLYFFLAETREEAAALHRRAHAHLTEERRRDSVKSILGLDIGGLALDARVTPQMLPTDAAVRSRTHADLLRRYIAENSPRVEDLLSRPEVVGSAHWVSVGTVEDVLADIVEWFEAGAMDGFIALPGGSIGSLHLFLNSLVPALAERGLFRSRYAGSTLRAHLGMPG